MAPPRESTTKTDTSGTKDVLLHRLIRSMSGRDIVNSNVVASPGVTSVDHEGSEDVPSLTRTQSATSLSSQASRKRRLSVADRLKRLSLDLPLLRRNGKSEPASPRVTLVEPEDVDTNASDTAIMHRKMLSMVDEGVEDTQPGTDPSTSTTDNHSLSPTNLAQRLRDLIDPLPFPSFSYPVKPKLPPRDQKGRPIPPQTSPIKDSRLIELLSSATFMNGSQSGDKHRPSVWEILEGLVVPPHGFPEAQSSEPGSGGGDSNDQPVDDLPDYAGTASVMLYSPLIPGKDDIVELAELVPFSVEERVIYDPVASKSWTSMWPLSLLPNWPQSNSQIPIIETPLTGDFSGNFVHSDVTGVDNSGRKFRVTTTSAWVPSTTKMSFQAMWWGYRLWLPPPVMDVLSDRSLEAAKRATLIATALAWFFNNLPVNLFPPPVRPALLLLQRIVPYLGYIATFISWSWGAIKGYDLGHGVTLTATWLLPFALIPGTWYEKDVPKSPPQSPPQSPPATVPGTSPPMTSPSTPSQPPVDIPNGPTSPPTTGPPPTSPPMASPPITDPPTTSPPIQPSEPGDSPSQPSPEPTLGSPSPLPQQPTTPASGTDDPTISPPNVSVPTLAESLLVSSPRSFAKKLFALSSPAKLSAVGPSPLSPPLTPVPMPRTPVPAGSVLGEELLHAPALRSIPLPNESSDTLVVMHKRRKEKKTNPLFHRIGK